MKYFTTSRPVILLAVFLTVASLLLVAVSWAQEFPPEPDTGFEIEGNAAWDHIGDYDWETAARPPAVLLADPHSKATTDPTIFKPDGKFDKPEDWSIVPGSVGPGQSELTNVLAWAIPPGELDGAKPQDFWLLMAMERTKEEGTFFLDFEYNQLAWDGTSGGPSRSAGDIVVGFELKGNPVDRMADLSVLIVQYLPGAQPALCQVTPGNGGMPERVEMGTEPCPAYGDSGFYYRFLADGGILADSGLGQATMNEQPFPAPWPSYDAQGNSRSTIGSFQFAEAAINLTMLGIEPTCSTFSSMHAKTRSSLEPNSDLKDISAAVPLSTNCRIDGHKFLDINGDGVWDQPDEPPLPGWQIALSDGSTTLTDDDGYYEFEHLADGDYTVSEVCPDEWVQTAPGMTGFDDCGAETFEAAVDIRHREVSDLDFGNGKPSVDVVKSCPADVFLGDDVAVEITVTNDGNVDLHDVTVVDDLIGLDETIDVLAPAEVKTYTGAFVATPAMVSGGDTGRAGGYFSLMPLVSNYGSMMGLIAQDPVTNTVTVEAQYAAVTVKDSDKCTTEVHELSVEKDAQTSSTAQYDWFVEKTVDRPGPLVLLPGQPATLRYTITVDLVDSLPVLSDWTVSGTIIIHNPAPMDAPLARVVDEMSGGIMAAVDCPSLTVPAEGSLTCTYGPTSLPDGSLRNNTATAVLSNNNGAETAFSGSAIVAFDEPTQTIDEQIDVFDSALVSAANPTGYLATVSYDEAPVSFTYQRSIGPFAPDQCQSTRVTLINTATIVSNDTGTEDSDTATTSYLCVKTITVASEDLPLTAGNDWDYNDIVVDIQPVLVYSAQGDLLSVSFAINQQARLSAFTHAFYFRPAAFACNGTYTRVVNGVTVNDHVPFTNGDDILVINDTGTLQPVELTIEFDVPAPGACPLDLSQPQFDLVGKYHGEGLFFSPWVLVNNTEDGIQEPVLPSDPRLLNVPLDWAWPGEATAIWLVYTKVSPPLATAPEAGPVFVPLWWLP
jgi:hypothetical protein